MLIQALSPIRPLQMSMAGATWCHRCREDEDINLLAGDRVEQRFTNRGLKGGLAKIMLQSSLDWFRKLVVWSGLECKTYIIKWFGTVQFWASSRTTVPEPLPD